MRQLAGLFALILAALVCLVAISNIVFSADLPRGLGHPKDGEADPYALSCCHGQHCEPVEPGAIVEVEGGYQVLYYASRGFIAKGFIAYGSPGIHQSFDRQEHACATAEGVRCIYIHFGA